jgi:hypothetical protein
MGRNEEATPRMRQELLDAGISRRALAKQEWVSPHRGFHRNLNVNDPVRQRILDAAAVMPQGAVIGGWAAAYLHGLAYLDGSDEPVLLVVPPQRRLDRPGIETVRTELDPADTTSRHGVACTNGARTAFDLLRLAPGLTGAVVAGDCMLHAGLTTAGAVLEYAAAHPGRRGARQLRKAVPLLEPGAASPPESRLRMLCHLWTDLPRLLVNVPVYDRAGSFLGIPDLLEPTTGLVIEYDGEYHRELGQHTADNLREEGLESAGLTVVRVTSLDLRDRRATAARISTAHLRLLRSPPPLRTWTFLHRLEGPGTLDGLKACPDLPVGAAGSAR